MSGENKEIVVDLLEAAWGIIANAGGGNWELESQEWRDAASRWRDDYHRTQLTTNTLAEPPLAGRTGAAHQVLLCPECRTPAIEDHNSFWCDPCRRLWPKGAGHELYVKEVSCPDCYGGHFRPCQTCSDSGVAWLAQSPNAPASATGQENNQ